MTQLSEAVVLITGAAGGFGQELTRQLLAAHSRLILTDLDQTLLNQQVEGIRREVKTGEVITCLAADLSSREGCETLYQEVQAIGQPIDILINNAGIGLYGRMDEVPIDQWERLMQVNLLAPMRLSTWFAADMMARHQGHIVNLSSVAGWIGAAGMAHYAASKFGLRGFGEGLANELKPYQVRVTTVYPWFSRTPILQSQQYGSLAQSGWALPDYWITDPAQVIRTTIKGIRRNQRHVFPDRISRPMHWLKRYAPWLIDAFL